MLVYNIEQKKADVFTALLASHSSSSKDGFQVVVPVFI